MSNPGGIVDYIDHRGFFYRVEGIVALKARKGKERLYLVEWTGGSRTWEPRTLLIQDIPGLVRRVDALAAAQLVSPSFNMVFKSLCCRTNPMPDRVFTNLGKPVGGIKR